jgi:thiamine biosynthesis lipoprotein
MKKSAQYLTLLIVTLLPAICSCNRQPVFHNTVGFTQGTTYSITYEIKLSTKTDKINRAIELRLLDIDSSLSVYNQASLISSINRGEDVLVDSLFADVFRVSSTVSQMTDGLFDITVGPLVKAWGFGPDSFTRFDSTRVDSLLEFVGFEKVKLVNSRVVKSDERITLDVNAVAQGYSVDVICSLLDSYNIKNYLVEIGGEVRTKGSKGDSLWRIGLDKPFENNNSPGEALFAVVELENSALATSGNYRKFYVDENGSKFVHTINPKSGSPARHSLLSATIIAPDCATADAFATACMVAGFEAAVELINKYEHIEGYLIYSGDKGEYLTWVSNGISDRIKEE